MKFQQLKTQYKESILNLASKRKINNVRVFGSVIYEDTHSKSDIDFLVHLLPGASLVDLSGFSLDLKKLLNYRVDVIPDNSIHWTLKEKILAEALPL